MNLTWQHLIGTTGHLKVLKQELAKVDKAFVRDLRMFFDKMGKEVVQSIEKQRGGIDLDRAFRQSYVHDVRAIIHRHLEQSAMVGAAVEWSMHQPRNTAKEVFSCVRKGVFDVVKQLPVKILDKIIIKISDAIEKIESGEIIQTIKKKTRKVIDKALGSLSGDRPREEVIKEAIEKEVFDPQSNENRSKAIVNTESCGGMGIGGQSALEALESHGIIRQKQWRCLHGSGNVDERTRIAHKEANYQTVTVYGKFWVGGERADYPGDPKLSARNRMHCRCLSIGVPEEN